MLARLHDDLGGSSPATTARSTSSSLTWRLGGRRRRPSVEDRARRRWRPRPGWSAASSDGVERRRRPPRSVACRRRRAPRAGRWPPWSRRAARRRRSRTSCSRRTSRISRPATRRTAAHHTLVIDDRLGRRGGLGRGRVLAGGVEEQLGQARRLDAEVGAPWPWPRMASSTAPGSAPGASCEAGAGGVRGRDGGGLPVDPASARRPRRRAGSGRGWPPSSWRTSPCSTTRPWLMSVIVSQRSSTRSSWWLENRRLRPARTWSRMTSDRNSTATGSRPEKGSSSTSSGGSCTIAAASCTRWAMPPDRSWILSLARSARPSCSSRCSARRRPVDLVEAVEAGDPRRAGRAPACRGRGPAPGACSPTSGGRRRWRAGPPTRPCRRRAPARRTGCASAWSCPAPLGPSSPMTWPAGTSRSTPSSTTRSPKRWLMPRASRVSDIRRVCPTSLFTFRGAERPLDG